MPINDRAKQYFDYQLRDVPSYDNPYDSYLEKRKKLEQELDKLGVQDDLERDRIAAEYLGRAPSTEAGYGTRFLDALASGGDQFQMNIGAMGEALGDKIGMAPLEIAGRNLAERNRQEMSYAPKFVDTPEEQSQKGFLRNLDDLSLQAVESLVGSSPAMLPPLAGAAIGGPLGVGVGIGGGLLGNAALEGGSTFSDYRNELIQRGYSEIDAERLARKARDEVFSENLTDAELLTYGAAQGLVGPMAKGLGVLGTGAIQAGTGGLQEGRQYEVTESATGNPMEQFTGRFSTPEGRNAMAVGMVAEMPMVAAEYGAAKYQQRFDPRVDADATAVIQEAKGRAQQAVNESEAIRKQQILEREQFLKEQRAAENERRKAEREKLKQIQQRRIDEEKLRQEQIKTDKARLQAIKDLSDEGQADTNLPDDGSADFVEPMTADQIMLQEYEARQQAEQEATQKPAPEPSPPPAPPPAPMEPEVVAEPAPEPVPEPEPTFSDELDQLDQLEEEQQQQQQPEPVVEEQTELVWSTNNSGFSLRKPEPVVEEQVDPAELEAAAAAKEQEIRQRIIDEIKSRAELGDKQPKGLPMGSANRLQNPVRVLQQIAGDEVVETQLSFEQLRLLDQTLSSERRKEVVNEAIKEVLQRQPASSIDISQGVDLREPEIQESTMTPPAQMETTQEDVTTTPEEDTLSTEVAGQDLVQDQTDPVVEETAPLPESLPEETSSNLSSEFQALLDLERQQEEMGTEAEQAGAKHKALVEKGKKNGKFNKDNLTPEENAERKRLYDLRVAFNKLDKQIEKAYAPYQAEVDRLEQEVGNAVEALPLADRQRFNGLFRKEVNRQALNPDDEISQLRLAQKLIQQLREGGLATKEEIANAKLETETVDTASLEEFASIYDEESGPSAEDLAALEAEGLSETAETDTQSELARLIAEQGSDIEQDRGAAALRESGGTNEVGFDEGGLYDPNAQDFNIRDEEYDINGNPRRLFFSYSAASRPTNAAGPSTKLTARQVKAAMEGVKSVLKKLDPNGDKVTVVANKDEAVAKLREMGRKKDADDLAKRGDDVMEEGFVLPGTGQIFLVADQIEGGNLREAVDRMVEVTFHEALGHAGLRGLMGDNFGKFVKNFGVKNGKKIDAWLKTEDGSVYSDDDRTTQIEEYIARNFAEKGVQNVGFVEGLAQDVLQSLGMRKYSETALKRAMIKVQDSYVGNDGDIVDGTRGQVEEDEELRNVETVESPLVAAFQRWFGDSKVLDESGNPRVVYHGTGGGEIVSFDPSKRGSFTKAASAKKGFFFAGNPKTARLYFDQNKITRNRTNGYYLKMENPLVYDQKGGPRKKLYNDIIKDAIRKGHDGVIIKNTFDGRREAGRGPQDDIFVVFDNKQIKRVDNKGTFNPDDERVKYSRRQRNIFNKPVPNSPSFVLPEDTKVERAIYYLVDKQIDTKRVIEEIEKNIGALKDEFNSRELETLFHGRVTEGTLDFLENKMRPILKGMQEKKISTEELGYYLHARGAERRNIEMAKRNKKDPKIQQAMLEGGSGMKTTVARKYLSSLSSQKAADFDELAQQVYDITQATRDLLVSEGLETQGTINAWFRAYGREYVPLMRELSDFEAITQGAGEGQGMSVSGPASKGATGSTEENVDHGKILANVFSQYERTLVRAEKNKVAKSLYALAVQFKNPLFWRPIDPKGVKEVGKAINALKALGVNPLDAQNIFAQPTRRRFDFKQRGEVIEEVSQGLRANNVLVARINGEDKLLVFNANDDRATRMVSALKNLDTETMGLVANLHRYITRWSTLTNTAYSLPFGITNFTRDVQGAMFNLTNTAIAGEQAKVLKETLPALKGIYSQIRNIDGGKNNYSQLWEEFRKAGGKTGYREMYNYGNARQEQIVDELKKMSEGKYNPKKPLRWVAKWVTDYNDALENAVRLAAYKTAIDKGLSVQKAAVLAKNLTVNFNRKGAKVPGIGAYYAFFNAAVQGTARTTEMLGAGRDQQSKNPYKKYLGKRGRQIIQGGLMVGAMQAIMMEMADYPDEEPPYFVRERNIIIPLDWVNNTGIPLDLDKKYISIPMPLGLHVIPNIGRTIMESVLKGELPDAEKVWRLTVSIFDAFNPLGSGGSFLQTILPTSVDPIAAIGQNMDWTGRRIYQEDIDSTKPTPGYTRANEGASALATEIARFINLMSGGTDFKKGVLSPTPDQLEYVGGQVTGGVGREIGKLIQTVETGFGTLEELPPYKIPLGGRFYGNIGSSAAISNQFFTNITRMNEHQAEIEGLIKSGRAREAQQYIRDNPEARLYDNAGKFENSVRKLRKQRREMKERDLPRKQIETIENLIRSQMEALNNMVKKYK